MDLLITVLSFGLALSLLVLVHELGHLLAAKRARVVVEEFGIGYPPRLLALGRNEGVLVAGGRRIVIPKKFAWPRELGVGADVALETAADAKGRAVLVKVAAAEAGGPSSRIEFLDRGTIYSINAVPFGGFTKMLGEEDPTYPGSLGSKGKLARTGVLVAGAGMNLLTAVLFFALAYTLGAPTLADPENAVVSAVVPGSPAALAGLQAGDLVLRADGEEILTVESLQAFTQAHLGQAVTLSVLRDGAGLEVTLVPRAEPPAGEGPMGITLSPRTVVKASPWYEAAWLGLKETAGMAVFTLSVPIQLIRGLLPADLARPVGPVGVGQLVGDAVRFSLDSGWWFPVMQMLGSLSVALAVTNLLPLPALDGGRILFILVEAVRGRRIDPAREGLVHLVGMALLLLLMVFITVQDVVNPMPRLDWSSLF